MKTASTDVIGPLFGEHIDYPTFRTTRYFYENEDCNHLETECTLEQLRRADEGPSMIIRCLKCNLKKIKH